MACHAWAFSSRSPAVGTEVLPGNGVYDVAFLTVLGMALFASQAWTGGGAGGDEHARVGQVVDGVVERLALALAEGDVRHCGPRRVGADPVDCCGDDGAVGTASAVADFDGPYLDLLGDAVGGAAEDAGDVCAVT